MTEHRPIEEIKAELDAAMEAERLKCEEKAKSVMPDYLFTLVRTHKPYVHIFDDSCTLYTLTGLVKNKEELRKVGKVPFEGSMDYIYNEYSLLLVTSVGGGSIFTNDPDCFKALSDFVKEFPSGGDVTNIVNLYRKGN